MRLTFEANVLLEVFIFESGRDMIFPATLNMEIGKNEMSEQRVRRDID